MSATALNAAWPTAAWPEARGKAGGLTMSSSSLSRTSGRNLAKGSMAADGTDWKRSPSLKTIILASNWRRQQQKQGSAGLISFGKRSSIKSQWWYLDGPDEFDFVVSWGSGGPSSTQLQTGCHVQEWIDVGVKGMHCRGRNQLHREDRFLWKKMFEHLGLFVTLKRLK